MSFVSSIFSAAFKTFSSSRTSLQHSTHKPARTPPHNVVFSIVYLFSAYKNTETFKEVRRLPLRRIPFIHGKKHRQTFNFCYISQNRDVSLGRRRVNETAKVIPNTQQKDSWLERTVIVSVMRFKQNCDAQEHLKDFQHAPALLQQSLTQLIFLLRYDGIFFFFLL